MRLWSCQILKYLPDLQFKGQLREIILIKNDWQKRGKTNHLLINNVMNYDKKDLFAYFNYYSMVAELRGVKVNEKYYFDFIEFCGAEEKEIRAPYQNWLETKEHLRVEMANLYEKYKGVGKSKITDIDWQRLLKGYKAITGEDYKL